MLAITVILWYNKDMDDLKQIIADNISFYRREAGLTQAELAEKLSYTDKAVSKWERAESYPDIATLAAMAKLFGVSVNELIADRKKAKKTKPLLCLLACGLVWLVATIVYVLLNIIVPELQKTWLIFIYAVPVCAIVFLVFMAIWKRRLLVLVGESVIMWSIAACIFLTLPSLTNGFFVFFLPIPLQLLAILWYNYRTKGKAKFTFNRQRVKNNCNAEPPQEKNGNV